MHIFMFTDRKNNRFQKKLIVQNTNIYIYLPLTYRAGYATRGGGGGGGQVSCAFMG